LRSVDTTRFKLKTKRVRLAFAQSVVKTIIKSAQEVYDKTSNNLSGPGIKPGTPGAADDRIGLMPVPRRTGDLSRSLTMTPLGPAMWIVWCDPHVASYAKYVHDGTTKMKPRRFLGDVVDENRPIIREKVKHKLLAAIRMEGRR